MSGYPWTTVSGPSLTTGMEDIDSVDETPCSLVGFNAPRNGAVHGLQIQLSAAVDFLPEMRSS